MLVKPVTTAVQWPCSKRQVDRGMNGGSFLTSRLLIAICLTASFASANNLNFTHNVNVFIGTGGHGHTFPGATLPFGMVQLSPDTRLEGWDGCSGYHYSDTVVYGFSHTHLSGTGVSDYGDILFMPTTGEIRFDNGHGGSPDEGYASRFDKATERAAPGWYAVHLEDYGIDIELTATERTGFHRYTYPKGRTAHLMIDLEHRDRVLESEIRIVGDHEVEGFRRSDAWARDQVVYFVARFSRPISETSLHSGDVLESGAVEASGTTVKAALSFGDAGGELLVKVGISSVDIDGARRNLEAELPGWDFDALRTAATGTWNDALSVIEIEGGTADQRTIFYTALYHSMLAPNVFSDVDGRYRGMDRHIHQAGNRRHYTVFSLWDTFRATHPLFTIIEPQRTAEFVNTFLAQYEQGGRLPVWELAGNETDCMIGYHSVSVIADAYIKGIRDFDADLALEAMVHSATTDLFGLDAYQRQGFIGADDEPESVSKTLEYAYDDWCIARFAETIGNEEITREFDLRSQAWRHLLDPETGFMRARLNQRWIEDFDPRRVDLNYTEANAWQYSFFVPHDLESLIDELGGDEAFVARLDALFSADIRTTGRDQADITGLIGQYAHGNEPSHHVAWLYHFAGQPDEGQQRVREILDTLYTATPDGLSGNEDCGQMSSWYVLSAMGLYPVSPGSPDYVIGAPLFPQVTIHLEDGATFITRSTECQGTSVIQSARLNDQNLSRSFLRHQEITGGGLLELKLGDPGTSEWGHQPADRPHSRVEGIQVVPAPYAVTTADTFREHLTIDLESATRSAQIHFAFGEQPSPDIESLWPGPTALEDTTTVIFRAEVDGRSSPTVRSTFHRIQQRWKIEVASVPNAQYTAGGPDALVDGLRGPEDWRLGGWQGYQDTDFEAVVDLGEVQPISRAGASFMQDVRSWIWMPTEITLWVSTDGVAFTETARITHDLPDDEQGCIRRELVTDLEETEARFVKVHARNYGAIPDWHPGRGGEAFIFIDEILVE